MPSRPSEPRTTSLRSGPAAEAGLKSGDVILMVNHEYITSLESLYLALVRSGSEALIVIYRNGNRAYISLRY